jgi:ABC-type Zn uptake system ZnuABC Zn-binding protein ZnuA/ABC-type Mn2+/Zn2+ transport system permease subunit
MKRWLAILVALFILVGGAALMGSSTARSSDTRYVVTTLPVIADIVRNVAGDRVVVESLVAPGVTVMTYQLTPEDSEKMARSDLFLYVGYGREDVLGTYARAIGEGRVVSLLELMRDQLNVTDPKSFNPYFWLDPDKAKILAERVAQLLSQLDPEGGPYYRANAEAYGKKLENLDRWIKSQLELIPSDKRRLVTVTNTMSYFAEKYGLEVLGYVREFPGTYEPQTSLVVALFERIVDTGVPAVFVEYEEATTTLREVIEAVAGEAGVPVYEPLYIESLAPNGEADTYIEMMKQNTELIVAGLTGLSPDRASPHSAQQDFFDNPILRPFKYEFMRRGMLALLSVVVMASLVGGFAVLRGWAIFGDALGHGAIAGLVAAYLFGFDYFLGAVGAGLAVALAVSSVERRTRLRADVVIGVTFTSMLALAIAVLSYIGGATVSIEDILFADVTAVSQGMLVRTVTLSALVIAVAILFRRPLTLYTIDPLGASALGVRTGVLHYGLLLLLATTVITAFMTIGAIPAIAAFIIPPAAAFLISKRPLEFTVKSVTIGAASAISGLYISFYGGTNAGAATILVAALLFAAAVIYKSLKGA